MLMVQDKIPMKANMESNSTTETHIQNDVIQIVTIYISLLVIWFLSNNIIGNRSFTTGVVAGLALTLERTLSVRVAGDCAHCGDNGYYSGFLACTHADMFT